MINDTWPLFTKGWIGLLALFFLISCVPQDEITAKPTVEDKINLEIAQKLSDETTPIATGAVSLDEPRQKISPELVKQLKEEKKARNKQKIHVLIDAKNKEELEKIKKIVSESGGEVKQTFDVGSVLSVELPLDKVEEISQETGIIEVAPEKEYVALVEDRITAFSVDKVWENNITGNGVRIAILDTGVGPHDAINVKTGKSFVSNEDEKDQNGHGTHVAGIAQKVAKDAVIYNAKVLSKTGGGTTSQILAGINWAVNPDGDDSTDDGADIISMSFGGLFTELDGPLASAVKDAIEKGVIFVAASGNCKQGCGGFYGVTTPGNVKEVIAVGAVDDSNNAASFSSGDTFDGYIKPDVVAPGVDITSAWLENGEKTLSGTSMSTPFVSGLIALMLEKENFTQEEAKEKLTSTAKDLGDEGGDTRYGAGVVDVERLLLERQTTVPDNQANQSAESTHTETLIPEIIGNYELAEIKTPPESPGKYTKIARYVGGEQTVRVGVVQFEDSESLQKFLYDYISYQENVTIDENIIFRGADESILFWTHGLRYYWIFFDDEKLLSVEHPLVQTYIQSYPSNGEFTIAYKDPELEKTVESFVELLQIQETDVFSTSNNGCTDSCDAQSYKTDLTTTKCDKYVNYYKKGITYNDETCSTKTDYCSTSTQLREYYLTCNSGGFKWCSCQGFTCLQDETKSTDQDCSNLASNYVCQNGACVQGSSCSTSCDGSCQSSGCYNIDPDCTSSGGLQQCNYVKHSYKQCYSGNVYWYDTSNVRNDIYATCASNQKCVNSGSTDASCQQKTCSDYSGTYGSCSSENSRTRSGNNVLECQDFDTTSSKTFCYAQISTLGNSDFCSALATFGQTCNYGEYDCDSDSECFSNGKCLGPFGDFSSNYYDGCCNSGDTWNTSTKTCRGSSTCTPQYTGNKQCSGNTPQSEYQNSDCSKTWISQPACSGGQTCQNGNCVSTNTCTDNDGDGYGNPGSSACSGGSQTDCNDGNKLVSPGQTENCDTNIDDNCSGSTNEGCCPNGVCNQYETDTSCSSDCKGDLQVLSITAPSSADQGQTITIQATIKNQGTYKHTLYGEAGIAPDYWQQYGYFMQGYDAQLSVDAQKCCTGNDFYAAKSITLDPGASQTVTFSVKAPSVSTIDSCWSTSVAKSAWDTSHTVVVGLYKQCAGGYWSKKTQDIKLKDKTCYSDNDCGGIGTCKFDSLFLGKCTPKTCANTCTKGTYTCQGSSIYKCEDANGDGCNENTFVTYCGGSSVCINGKSACETTYASTKLALEESGGTITAQKGDIITVTLKHSKDENVQLEYDPAFSLDTNSCPATFKITSDKNCTFTVKETSAGKTQYIGLKNGPRVSIKTINPQIVIVTNKKKLHQRFDDANAVNDLLKEAYNYALKNEGILYDLEDYIAGHPWSDFSAYSEEYDDQDMKDNSYSLSAAQLVKEKCGSCKNVMVLGDDFVVPHFRRDINLGTWYGLSRKVEETYTDISYAQHGSLTFDKFDELFKIDGKYQGKKVLLLLPDSLSTAEQTAIDNLRQVLKDEGYNPSFETKNSSSIICNDPNLFSDFNGRTLFIIGTENNNKAFNCLPFVSGLELRNTFFMEVNPWDGRNHAVVINTEDSKVIDFFAELIEDEGYYELRSYGAYVFKTSAKTTGYVALGVSVAAVSLGSFGTVPAVFATIGFVADGLADTVDVTDSCVVNYEGFGSCGTSFGFALIPWIPSKPVKDAIKKFGDDKLFSHLEKIKDLIETQYKRLNKYFKVNNIREAQRVKEDAEYIAKAAEIIAKESKKSADDAIREYRNLFGSSDEAEKYAIRNLIASGGQVANDFAAKGWKRLQLYKGQKLYRGISIDDIPDPKKLAERPEVKQIFADGLVPRKYVPENDNVEDFVTGEYSYKQLDAKGVEKEAKGSRFVALSKSRTISLDYARSINNNAQGSKYGLIVHVNPRSLDYIDAYKTLLSKGDANQVSIELAKNELEILKLDFVRNQDIIGVEFIDTKGSTMGFVNNPGHIK